MSHGNPSSSEAPTPRPARAKLRKPARRSVATRGSVTESDGAARRNIVIDGASSPAQPNQGVIDLVRLLQAVVFASGPISSTQLARQMEMDQTRVHRFLRTLTMLGVLYQTRSRNYTVGPAMNVMVEHVLSQSEFLRLARPALEYLNRSSGWEVAMGVLWQENVSYLYHAPACQGDPKPVPHVTIFPALRSSIGHVLMRHLQPEQVRQLHHRTQADLSRTVPLGTLLSRLRTIRRDGFAVVHRPEEKTGRVSVAVPLVERPFAAIAVGGDIAPEQIDGALAVLRAAAAQIDAAVRQCEEPKRRSAAAAALAAASV